MISSVVFVSVFIISISIFTINCKRIYRNISLGKKILNVDKKQERIKKTLLIAFGQSKMFERQKIIKELIVLGQDGSNQAMLKEF